MQKNNHLTNTVRRIPHGGFSAAPLTVSKVADEFMEICCMRGSRSGKERQLMERTLARSRESRDGLYMFVAALIRTWAGQNDIEAADGSGYVIEHCRNICDRMGWVPFHDEECQPAGNGGNKRNVG